MFFFRSELHTGHTGQLGIMNNLQILKTKSEFLLWLEFELNVVFYAAGVKMVLKALHFLH